MALFKVFLGLILGCFLTGEVLAMPTGPPMEACALLEPNHDNTTKQTGVSPTRIFRLDSSYTPTVGNTLEFTIFLDDSSIDIKGFMIQARRSEFDAQPLGMFIDIGDRKQQVMTCQSADDTAAHRNPTPVTSVDLQWTASSIDESITNFRFYYTIVSDFNTYWVRIQSDEIQVIQPIQPPRNYALVKAHGSIMTLAWGLFAPVGIMLALFYKVVWPNGEWFYSHIAVMVATLLLTIVGVIVIVIHAGGLWLTSTEINLPHQILGIIAFLAVGSNPFLAIIRCDPSNQWRWIYNWIHGTIGLVLGQGIALAAMLLGLNIFKDLPGVQRDTVHYAIYTMSCTVGLVTMIIASYNLYTITFRKHFPSGPDKLATASESPGVFPDKPLYTQSYEDGDEAIEPSRDYQLRAAVGLAIIILLALFAIATIIIIALA